MLAPNEMATRAQLLADGLSRRTLSHAVAAGAVIRVRRDRYVAPEAPAPIRQSVRVGGRLTCLSLLQLLDVFVLENTTTHVHIERGASRLRSPAVGVVRLEPRADRSVALHWSPLARTTDERAATVATVDALIHAVRCQSARPAIATLDSALNKGLIVEDDLIDVFAALPARFGALRPLIDGRAESGPETLVRLMLRAIGCDVTPQVTFTGIGRVDLVVDGWLVVECDSKEFHSDWAQQVKDRERDLALAARGFTTLRLTAAQIMYRPDAVIAALRGLVAARAAARVV